MTEKLQQQISLLCSEISAVEWSGALFYTVEGKFGTPEFKIVAEELHLLDIGSQGYTEYQFDEEFVSFLMKNPRLLKMNRGHIHSHNTMSVFFSGTDNSELTDNAPNINYYLSLIVNNKNDMTARVAFVADIHFIGKRITTFKDTNGEPISVERETDVTEQKVYFYDCEIEKPAIVPSIFERIQTIRNKKTSYHTSKYGSQYGAAVYNSNYANGSYSGGGNQQSLFQWNKYDEKTEKKAFTSTEKRATNDFWEETEGDDWYKQGKNHGGSSGNGQTTTVKSDNVFSAINSKFNSQNSLENIEDENVVDTDDAVMDYEEAVEEFSTSLVLCDVTGNYSSRYSSTEEAIDFISERKDKIPKREWYDHCNKVKDSFHTIYHRIFDDPEMNNLVTVIADTINHIRTSAPIGTNVAVTDICDSIEDAVK